MRSLYCTINWIVLLSRNDYDYEDGDDDDDGRFDTASDQEVGNCAMVL